MKNDDLGNRMKKYEYITRTHLVPRMPVVIRIDGKAFHTFTRGFKRPFDNILVKTMQQTMKYLCENIQGCMLGYTQSYEITLVLVDYKKLDSASWFDYNIQKCCSVAASMATMAFNKYFPQIIREQLGEFFEDIDSDEDEKYLDAIDKAMERGAMFDARVFNIPKEEVTNCILWRQNDATRNSIEMVGQAYFSHIFQISFNISLIVSYTVSLVMTFKKCCSWSIVLTGTIIQHIISAAVVVLERISTVLLAVSG